MRRKLIKQGGGGGMTIYLPKKWTRELNLKPGQEVNIEQKNQTLLILPENIKKDKTRIRLKLPTKESLTRTLVVNAYRAGFDIIEVEFEGKINQLNCIVEKQMIGFEVFTNQENIRIESVSEPDYEKFDNIVLKQFYILSEISRDVNSEMMEFNVNKIQKYDNFLKRCITKGIFDNPAKTFLWQMLSELTHIARLFLHLKENINSKNKLEEKHLELLKKISDMVDNLKEAYIKKDHNILREVHRIHDNVTKEIMNNKKVGSLNYHLILITKQIYLTNSPLTGLIQTLAFED